MVGWVGFTSSGWLGFEPGSSLYCTLGGGDQSGWELAPVAQFDTGPSGGQLFHGACRSKRLLADEHPPDRLGQFAGDLDGGDLAAAFAAVAAGLAGEHGFVAGVAQGGVGCLDERPAQVVGAVFA